MATIHFASREIIARIVYFGAPGAGSNTNVRSLYGLLTTREKSRLHHFGPQNAAEESWYFEYVHDDRNAVPGFSLRLRVYSMPGGQGNAAHREEVFRGVDAVVFVADARKSRAAANVASLAELEKLIREQALTLERVPCVIQVNHSDAMDARDPADVVVDLNPYGFPVVPAVARATHGVLDTHERLVEETCARLRDNLAGNQKAIDLASVDVPVESDEQIIARHLSAIDAAEKKNHPSLEFAVHDFQRALSARYASLTPGARHELGFQPKEYIGTRPVHLLDAKLEGDQIVVDLVMERLAGGEPRRLQVVLCNRPTDQTPMPRNTNPSPPVRDTATSSLPDRVELPPPEPVDFPPVWYGVLGVTGGALVGLAAGFLFFA